MKRGFVIILVILAALLGLLVFGIHRFVSIDDLAACGEKPTVGECIEADAIVVVSGGNTSSRTEEAIRLYKYGWAPKLIVSGAAQDTSSPSNAAAMRQQAIASGVPAPDILLDEAAKNTSENASGVVELAKKEGIHNIILVTSPYHLARTSLVFNRAFAGVGTVRAHPSQYDASWSSNWWMTRRGWWLLGSEVSKTAYELVTGQLTKDVR